MSQCKMQLNLIKDSIVTIKDYPSPGILFRDITGILEHYPAFNAAVSLIIAHYKNKGITKVVGTEARGFVFGAPVALGLEAGFVLVRKPNKLPRPRIKECYELEYGTDCLEIHEDAIKPEDTVLIVDDLLATGGTVSAAIALIRRLGGKVEHAAFVIELAELGGNDKLKALGVECYSLVDY